MAQWNFGQLLFKYGEKCNILLGCFLILFNFYHFFSVCCAIDVIYHLAKCMMMISSLKKLADLYVNIKGELQTFPDPSLNLVTATPSLSNKNIINPEMVFM